MIELKRPLAVVALLLLVGLTGCTGASVPRHKAAAVSTPQATPTSAVASVFGVISVHRLLAALALPRSGSGDGFAYDFGPAVLSGSSSMGDFGSAAWNIDYTSSRGNGTWAAQLHVFEKASQARTSRAHGDAARALCSSRPTPVAGFGKAAARTVAVACQGFASRPGWWLIVDRADQQTWLITATNLPSRELATAAARSIVGSLGATVTEAEVALHKLSLPS